ncbi:TonB-dependent receptor family protein [Eoetvoesiella caeni]
MRVKLYGLFLFLYVCAAHADNIYATGLSAAPAASLAVTAIHARELTTEAANEMPTAGPSAQLAPIVVQGGVEEPLSPLSDAAQVLSMQRLSGNVSLVRNTQYDGNATLNLGDALTRTAGVYAHGAPGQEAARLSIRGSGLASILGMRGVRMLRDGLPLSRIDDIIDPSYANLLNADRVEIYRGGNALTYGAATLGGAINLVSVTGYTRPGFQARLEAGSHGYINSLASGGQVFNTGMDAYASVSSLHSNGQGADARQENTQFYGNLGFRFSPASEGRLHLSIASLEQGMPNPQTLAQAQGEASANEPAPVWPGRRVKTQPYARIAYQHTFRPTDQDQIDFGVYHAQTRFNITGSYAELHYDAADYGASIRSQSERTWNGRKNQFIWGLNIGQGRDHNATYGPFRFNGRIVDPTTEQYERIYGARSSIEVFAQNSYNVTRDLAVVAGVQAIRTRRHFKIDALRNPPFISAFKNVNNTAHYTGINPKLGLLWQVMPKAQVFANISKSLDSPSSLEFYNSETLLAPQRALTVELGTRGGEPTFHWEAALYHSRIKNELLSLAGPQTTGRGSSANAGTTAHSGAEIQLGGRWRLTAMPGAIDWSIVHTWNRFRFVDDPIFGNNAIPSVPDHFGRIDLTYRHPTGVYAGPSLVYSSGWQVDQANTLKAPGYGVINFTLGYAAPSGRYTLFLDARNLNDKRYAASSDYISTATGPDQRAFYSGLGRSLFVGASVKW